MVDEYVIIFDSRRITAVVGSYGLSTWMHPGIADELIKKMPSLQKIGNGCTRLGTSQVKNPSVSHLLFLIGCRVFTQMFFFSGKPEIKD